MKRVAPLAILSVGVLAITGCGSGSEQSEAEALEEDLLEGMGCEDADSPEECGEQLAEEFAESAPEPGDMEYDDADWEDVPVDEMDTARMSTEPFDYGQTAALRDGRTGQDLGTIAINYIDNQYECNGSTVLAVEVEVNTVGESNPVTLTPSDFYLMDGMGEILDGAAPEGCETELNVAADDEGSELLLFDLDTDLGQVALDNEHSNAYWVF